MATEFVKATNTFEKLRLINAALQLSQHLSEFDGQMQDKKLLIELDEALIRICGVNSWEEVLEFVSRHSIEVK